jgi:hypothetical protein
MLTFGRADDWAFRDDFYDDRGDQLMNDAPDYRDIVERIRIELGQCSATVRQSRDLPLKPRRVEFSFVVLPVTCDAFFNGPTGYRAQYYIDPDLGQAANGYTIETLHAKLEHAFLAGQLPDIARDEMVYGLRAASAKIWIEEQSDRTPALAVDRWVDSARENGGLKSQMALTAPQGVTLEVKGAWIHRASNNVFTELVTDEKIKRRFEISATGFS